MKLAQKDKLKLALVYDPKCPKLTPESYSQTYRDMFLALKYRFDDVQEVTSGCSGRDIDCDVLVYFDIHSSQDIEITNPPDVVTYEYFNDPHQKEFKGKYKNGDVVHKLGAQQRAERAVQRGVNFVICPYQNGYWRYIAPHLGRDAEYMFLWFPVAPASKLEVINPVVCRQAEVLANGHTWEGEPGFRPYKFRAWAFKQPEVSLRQHSIVDNQTPRADEYQKYLSGFAGALALCDTYVVPKYLEIPLCGCVTIAQYLSDYSEMGFRDGEHCIYVTKKNFNDVVSDVRVHPESYQKIADAGRELVEEKYTADNFADFVYSHAARHLNG